MTVDEASGDAHTGGCTSTALPLGQMDAVLDAACRLLLLRGEPVPVPDVAAEVGDDLATVEAVFAGHVGRGRVAMADGAVVASAGVSVVPSDYEMRLGARRFWAWCAKTALGVAGALPVDGTIVSNDPVTGSELRTEFVDRRPAPSSYAAFWPTEDFRESCQSAAGEYCLTLNLFETAEVAKDWAQRAGVPGEVLGVDEATARASGRWLETFGIGRAEGDAVVAALQEPLPADVAGARKPVAADGRS
jgi:hypothetical protein